MNIVHLDASVLAEQSVSRELTAAVVADLRRAYPQATVRYRDLFEHPIGHWVPVNEAIREPGPAGQDILDEFLAADVVVIGAPMYNFGIPTQLKAWIDRIAVPGQTFRYTPNGPEGLAGDKRVIVVSSRGGIYSQGPAAAMDFQENYLRAFFGFIGVKDLEIVRAEGVSMSPEHRANAIQQAHQSIRDMQRKAA